MTQVTSIMVKKTLEWMCYRPTNRRTDRQTYRVACTRLKNKENQSLRNSYKKKLIFFKMQNFAPFCISVTSRFINVFFRKNSQTPSDTKVDHYNDYEGDYWVNAQMVLLEYISDICDRCARVLFSDKKDEMNADAPEWRKWKTFWAQTVFLFVPPK